MHGNQAHGTVMAIVTSTGVVQCDGAVIMDGIGHLGHIGILNQDKVALVIHDRRTECQVFAPVSILFISEILAQRHMNLITVDGAFYP